MLRTGFILACAAALVHGYSAGPPDRKTGRPGEGTCSDCHSGPAGSADSTRIIGLPGNTYLPESTYSLALSVRYAGQRRWGFELTSVDRAGMRGGVLLVTDSASTQFSEAGSGYLKQTSTGSRPGTPDSVVWTFGWRAPSAGLGPVTFFWCANAANNNGANSGDAINCGSVELTESPGIAEQQTQPGRCWWRMSRHGQVIIDYLGKAGEPVRIFAASGRMVRSLLPAMNGDQLQVVWDGRDRHGRPVSSAAFFVRLGDGIDRVVKVQLVR